MKMQELYANLFISKRTLSPRQQPSQLDQSSNFRGNSVIEAPQGPVHGRKCSKDLNGRYHRDLFISSQVTRALRLINEGDAGTSPGFLTVLFPALCYLLFMVACSLSRSLNMFYISMFITSCPYQFFFFQKVPLLSCSARSSLFFLTTHGNSKISFRLGYWYYYLES